MTPSQFRKMALSISGVVESEHGGHPDFRAGGKVIASLGAPDKHWGMVKLTPEQQQAICETDPNCFQPCQGAWGRQGYTNVLLSTATAASVRSALFLAVDRVAKAPSRKRPAASNSAPENREIDKVQRASKSDCEFDDSVAVDSFLQDLTHPLKEVIEAIRATIIKADKRITEGIKWNAPSCYCRGWFATTNFRSKSGVVLVLHHGAKVQRDQMIIDRIKDPSRLLTWASADRATITFVSVDDFKLKQKALLPIVKQWVKTQVALANVD